MTTFIKQLMVGALVSLLPMTLWANSFVYNTTDRKVDVVWTAAGCAGLEYVGCKSEKEKKDVAASFQRAALTDIYAKAHAAAETFDCQAIYLGGGVTQSKALRALFEKSPYPVFWPPKGLSLDNGAMIAGLGYHLYQRKNTSDLITPFPRMPHSE